MIDVLDIPMGFLKIFGGCPGYIWWLLWIYLMDVMEIFVGCNGDI